MDHDELYSLQAKLPEVAAEQPTGLQRLSLSDPIEQVLAALWRDGAVVIERAVSPGTADCVLAELQPYLAQQSSADEEDAGRTHGGTHTKRLGGILTRAPSSWEMVAHPLLLKVCELVIGKQLLHKSRQQLIDCFRNGSAERPPSFKFQCHLHQLIQIESGNEPQPFHEDLPWEYNFDAQLEPEVSTLWALNDFTELNGCTKVVLGSHRRRKAEGYGVYKSAHERAAAAECPKGSVVIFLGHTVHTGGRNRSGLPRAGLNVNYCMAWLRQEVNQYLDVPPAQASKLPKHLQDLIGYTRVNPSLGYVGAYGDPADVLNGADKCHSRL